MTEKIFTCESPDYTLIQRTWRVKDACGNVVSKCQMIRVYNDVGGVLLYHWNDATNKWVDEKIPVTDKDARCALQGSAVSMSENGSKIAVGGPCHNNGQGGIWIWTKHPDSWEKYGPITLDNSYRLGTSVSLNSTGDTIIASTSHGEVFTWEFKDDEWVIQSCPIYGSKSFGSSLSLSGDGKTMAVGMS